MLVERGRIWKISSFSVIVPSKSLFDLLVVFYPVSPLRLELTLLTERARVRRERSSKPLCNKLYVFSYVVSFAIRIV